MKKAYIKFGVTLRRVVNGHKDLASFDWLSKKGVVDVEFCQTVTLTPQVILWSAKGLWLGLDEGGGKGIVNLFSTFSV